MVNNGNQSKAVCKVSSNNTSYLIKELKSKTQQPTMQQMLVRQEKMSIDENISSYPICCS